MAATRATPERLLNLLLEPFAPQCKVAVRGLPDLLHLGRVKVRFEQPPVCLSSVSVSTSQTQIPRVRREQPVCPALRIRMIARPAVILWALDHRGAHRVELDITIVRWPIGLVQYAWTSSDPPHLGRRGRPTILAQRTDAACPMGDRFARGTVPPVRSPPPQPPARQAPGHILRRHLAKTVAAASSHTAGLAQLCYPLSGLTSWKW